MNLAELGVLLETAGVEALRMAGYPEAAAFLDLAEKFVAIGQTIVAEKRAHWDPAGAVAAAELGAMATIETEFPEGKP